MGLYLLSLLFLFNSHANLDVYEKAKERLIKTWQKKEPVKQRMPASEAGKTKKVIENYLLGSDSETTKNLRESLPKEDKKRNVLEIELASGLLYFESDTEYFYRKKRTYSPSLELGAKIWFSPYMGFQANYLSSLGASAKDDLNNIDTSIVSHEWFRFSFLKRLLLNGKKDHLTFSINYRNYQFKAPADSPTLGDIKNSFYGLGLAYTQKKSDHYQKELGFRIYFFGSEKEEGATIDFSSGELDKAYSFAVYSKRTFLLNKKHAFFAKLQYQLDKQLYSGIVSPADPKSGEAIEGLDIESNYISFQLGYEWGG